MRDKTKRILTIHKIKIQIGLNNIELRRTKTHKKQSTNFDYIICLEIRILKFTL